MRTHAASMNVEATLAVTTVASPMAVSITIAATVRPKAQHGPAPWLEPLVDGSLNGGHLVAPGGLHRGDHNRLHLDLIVASLVRSEVSRAAAR